MSRAPGSTPRRWIALLLLSAAVGLTIGAPLHARHDIAGDPEHQRACIVIAWSKAVQAAAVTPPAEFALLTSCGDYAAAERQFSTPHPFRLTPQARGPPLD